MAKMNPIVKTETMYVAIWVAIAILPVQAVFLLLNWWTLPVLLGSLLGSITAVGNFLLMCLTVQRALDKDKKDAARMLQLSQSGRLLLQGAVLIVAGVLPQVFNLWSTIIPLVIPTLAMRVRHLKVAKDHPATARPAENVDVDEE